jgi:hypothetical protein
MDYHPGLFETSVTWDVTGWVNTAARVNDLKLIVRNLDPLGKKVMVDQAKVEVSFGATSAGSGSSGLPITVTLFVTDGWNPTEGKSLAADGKVSVVNGSDDKWDEIESGSSVSYAFEDIPATSVILSAKVYVEHHEEEGGMPGGVSWQVTGGSLMAPTPLATKIPTSLFGELAEATVEWNVSTTINTASKVNNLGLSVSNQDLGGKKVFIDRAYVVVTHREP